MDPALGRILTSKSKITPTVGLEAVKKTWGFVTQMLPTQHISSVANKLATFFQEQEQKYAK